MSSEGWWNAYSDEADYKLILAFLDQSAAFTHGFEVGSQYARMRYGRDKSFQQSVHSENQRQLLMAAKSAGWSVRFEPLDDTFCVMHASAGVPSV